MSKNDDSIDIWQLIIILIKADHTYMKKIIPYSVTFLISSRDIDIFRERLLFELHIRIDIIPTIPGYLSVEEARITIHEIINFVRDIGVYCNCNKLTTYRYANAGPDADCC